MKKKITNSIFLILMSLSVITIFSSKDAKAATLNASRIQSVAKSKVGQNYANGYCLRFVEELYQSLGASRPYNCCAYKSGSTYIKSSSSDNIPVGATVYFGYCGGGPCKYCGSSYFGHVGIYVGDGYFVHATGGKIQKSTISSWRNKYRGWGYCGNFTLNNDLLPATPPGKNPVGVIDSAVDKMNEIQISGWAFDEDGSSQSIPVHVYIGGPVGTSGVEGHAIMANLSRPDVNNCFGIKGNHGYSATLSTNKTGTQPVYVYGINIGSGQNSLIGQTTINISNDTQSPSISNVQVTDITSTGYTVTCTVSDNKGVTSVKFPSWSQKSSGEKAKWLEGTISGNKATCRVNVIDLGNTKGLYFTHIYAYDKKGNKTGYAIKAINVDAKGLTEREPLDLGEEFSGYIMINDWSKVVSIGSTEVNVTSKKDTKSKKQRWTFKRNADGTYTIINKYNGKCLDVSGGAGTSGANVQVYDSNGTNAQKWYIYRADSGQYLLRPKCSNTCVLDLSNNSKEESANIQIYTFNATVAQSFVIVDEKQISEREAVNIGDTFYATIENMWDGKVMSIDSSKVNVVSSTRKESPDQYWMFKRSKEGYYTITSQTNGKLLEVEAGKDAENQNVQTQAATNANKQKWYVYEAGGGAYYLRPACSTNRVLTLSNYSPTEGVNILTRALVTTTAQRFMIKKCSHIWGDGKVTKDATCEEEGIKMYICTACGGKKTEVVPKIVQATATPTPEPTEKPTPVPTAKPVQTSDTTAAPTQTPKPTSTAEPIQTTVPTTTPIPTAEPSYDDDEEDDDIYDDMYDDMEDEEDDDEDIPPVGTILEDDEGQCVYKVTKLGKCVAFRKVINKKITQIEIPDTVTIDGIKYKVTEISSNAFRGCTKLKKVVIGKNVSRIGKKAFFGCKNLKKIVVKTKKLSIRNIGSKAFKGIHKKVIVQIPKGQQKKYKKLLIKLIKKITI